MLAQAIFATCIPLYRQVVVVTRSPSRLRASLSNKQTSGMSPLVTGPQTAIEQHTGVQFDVAMATTSTNVNYLTLASRLARHTNANLVLDYSAKPLLSRDHVQYKHISDPDVLDQIRIENTEVERRASAARDWIVRTVTRNVAVG